MKKKLALLKIALLRLCGVDELVRKAFYEGWNMAHDHDFDRLQREILQPINTAEQLSLVVEHSRCWRHVDEAWLNSDAEETV